MIYSAEYIHQLEKKDRYLEVINRYALQLIDCQTIDSILWTLAKHAIAEMGYVDCVIYLFDEKREFLVQRAAHGPKNPIDLDILNPILLKPGEGIVGHVAISGEGEIVHDTRLDGRYILDDDMRLSEIAVPLIHNGQVIGVIDSEHPDPDFYSEDDLDILITISSMSAAKIIQTQYLEELDTYKNELEDLVKDRTKKLEETIRSVEEKTKEIRLKNQDLMDSMIYARRIQKSILPSLNAMELVFSRFFLYFKPKEIVSGDFYWAKRQGNNLYFTVADCKGHGVPGSLLSIMGYNALNSVFNEKSSADPAEILNGLRSLIVENLRDVDEQKLHDGMDIGLCVYNVNRRTMSFAGANNSVVIVRKGELIELQGSKQSIGFHEQYISYQAHSVEIEPGDSVYLFSDGYKDQFGGLNKKKLKSTNFKNLLIECSELPINDRKEKLHSDFIQWTSGSEQVDDICILGIDF